MLEGSDDGGDAGGGAGDVGEADSGGNSSIVTGSFSGLYGGCHWSIGTGT